MIIGLTGKNCAGKGEAAEYLKWCGYIYYSLSDIIREEITKAGQTVSRETLIAMGNKLRTEGGPAVLAEMTLEKLDTDKNYIVDSVRNPAEVKTLKKRKDFFLLSIEADQKVRFERNLKRARENAPTTFEQFVAEENRELSSDNPAAQQLVATAKLADVVIENDSTVEELKEKIKGTLLELLHKKKRPSWDDYFMNIARMVAERSNCIKRSVAAVIIKDKRIISTGYNGTPRGIKNCSEGGCPRCNSFGQGGANLDECLCSHAEENAIVQAAYHGVSVKGGTIYTTFSPCLTCTKMIINSGLTEVIYNAQYPMGEVPLKLLAEAGVKARKV